MEYKFKLLKSLIYSIYKDECSNDEINQTIKNIFKSIKKNKKNNKNFKKNDEQTIILITYPDSFSDRKRSKLSSLNYFLKKYINNLFDVVHILPFFPSSSDDGFAVIDYRKVDPSYGNWNDIKKINTNYKIMADLVLNHGSSKSKWFENFLKQSGKGKDFFFSVSNLFDISKVVRPRSHKLLKEVTTKNGKKKVWCTFSHDQIDYDYTNLKFFEEIINLIIFFIKKNICFFRLDAIAYIYKQSGTECINHQKTHKFVKVFRLINDIMLKNSTLITETNLPNQENLSYFGNSNEANCIYNFSLPPLILYSFLFGNSKILRRWNMTMPPALEDTSYINFLSSHDGIGLRPLEGLISDSDYKKLIQKLKLKKSLFTTRKKLNKNLIYEANITFFDALKENDKFDVDRFISAHAIVLSIEGIPAIYVNSLFGSENYIDGVRMTNSNRTINRQKWNLNQIKEIMASDSDQTKIFHSLIKLIGIRKKQKAFHPNATSFTLQLGEKLFGIWRQSRDRQQSIFCITNFSKKIETFQSQDLNLILDKNWYDLITGDQIKNDLIQVDPYKTIWVSNLQ